MSAEIDVYLGYQSAITVLDTTVSETVAAGKVAMAGWSFRTTSVQNTQDAQGSQNAPAAGTTIASLVLPQGEWQISWQVNVSGTVGAAEINNFELLQGAAVIATSLNGNAVGSPYTQITVTASIPQGGATIFVKNIAIATAASVYSASIVASPVSAVAIAEITSGGNPVAEIVLGVGGTSTVHFGGGGIQLQSDLTLTVLAGSFRGAVYARIMLLRTGTCCILTLRHGVGSGLSGQSLAPE